MTRGFRLNRDIRRGVYCGAMWDADNTTYNFMLKFISDAARNLYYLNAATEVTNLVAGAACTQSPDFINTYVLFWKIKNYSRKPKIGKIRIFLNHYKLRTQLIGWSAAYLAEAENGWSTPSATYLGWFAQAPLHPSSVVFQLLVI